MSYKITVDKVIEWLQTIPNPKETEFDGLLGGSQPVSLKRLIYGEFKNYDKDEKSAFFVYPVAMGQHFPSSQDKQTQENWNELGQLEPSDDGGENINHLYSPKGQPK